MNPFAHIRNLSLWFVLSVPVAYAQKSLPPHQETIRKTFPVTAGRPLVSVHNPRGPVTVEAFSGKQIEIVIEKTITGSTTADVALGKREVNVVTEQRGDSVLAYVVAPQVQWCGNEYRCIHFSDEDPYTVGFVMKVKVPRQVNINLSTVQGDLAVTGVEGNIRAHSHQGLKLINVAGKTDASAHHGDLEATYTAPIPASSRFHTHHGDVRLTVPNPLNADIEYDSYHGDLYTDFPEVQALTAPVAKLVSSRGESKQYKLAKKNRFGSARAVSRSNSIHTTAAST